jgi:hypothetical protein
MDIIKKFINFYQKQDFVAFWSSAISILIALFIIIHWAIFLPILPSQLPLFYSLPWGEKQLGSLIQFLIIPGLIFLVCLVNLVVSWHLHPSQIFIKRLIVSSTLIVAILLLITSLKIIYTFV